MTDATTIPSKKANHMRKTLAAFTPPGFYPPYVNFTQTDDGVQLTIRSPAKPDGSCGDASTITISIDEFKALLAEAEANLYA